MGVLQSQFNSALTGLTFLAQQTPLWQRAKDVSLAKQEYSGMQEAHQAQDKALTENGKFGKAQKAAANELRKTQKEEKDKFLEEHKTVLPREYAKNLLKNKSVDLHKQHIKNMFAIRNAAQSAAETRQAEISQADTNMTNYIETIKQMRAEGIIKSNKQMKGMIYKAGKGDEN